MFKIFFSALCFQTPVLFPSGQAAFSKKRAFSAQTQCLCILEGKAMPIQLLHEHFVETCCIHLQGTNENEGSKHSAHTSRPQYPAQEI